MIVDLAFDEIVSFLPFRTCVEIVFIGSAQAVGLGRCDEIITGDDGGGDVVVSVSIDTGIRRVVVDTVGHDVVQ